MMMPDDRLHLFYIRQQIQDIERVTALGKETWLADRDDQAAVLFYMHTLSESAIKLSKRLHDQHPEVDWDQIRGFRNRIVHDYIGIDLQIVWTTIQTTLPILREAVEAIIASLDDETPDQPPPTA